MSATAIPVLTYEQAKETYRRLCAKARRLFNRENDESHILCSVVQAMSNSWDFSQGFPISDLKHLNAQDRADVLTLINYLVSEPYFPGGFDEINRAAFATL
jgi:hypothetical protein